MSVAHTPGPWTTNCPYGGTIYIDARISSKSMQEVASCGPTEEPDQQQANAILIAAAPDLLEAAIEYLAAGQYFITADDEIVAMLRFGEAEKAMRVAVAKATRGQS